MLNSKSSLLDEISKFKKRDLQSSNASRILLKTTDSTKVLSHQFVADSSDSHLDDVVNSILLSSKLDYYQPLFIPKNFNVKQNFKTCIYEEEKNETFKVWLSNRKKLRNKLKKFDLNISWLQRKPFKTTIESQVLARLRGNSCNDMHYHQKIDDFWEESKKKTICVFNVLKKIAKEILKYNVPLSLFDTNETGVTTYSQCKEGLLKVQNVTNLSECEKDMILKQYFPNSKDSKHFYETLLQAVSDCKTSYHACDEAENQKKIAYNYLRNEKDCQKRIQVYNKTIEKLKDKNLPFSELAVERGLLFPGDKRNKNAEKFILAPPRFTLKKDFWKEFQPSCSRSSEVSTTAPFQKSSPCDKVISPLDILQDDSYLFEHNFLFGDWSEESLSPKFFTNHVSPRFILINDVKQREKDLELTQSNEIINDDKKMKRKKINNQLDKKCGKKKFSLKQISGTKSTQHINNIVIHETSVSKLRFLPERKSSKEKKINQSVSTNKKVISKQFFESSPRNSSQQVNFQGRLPKVDLELAANRVSEYQKKKGSSKVQKKLRRKQNKPMLLNLSHKNINVGAKVDSWLPARYQQTRSFLSPHKSVDSNSFWTSHHLDKIRLCKSPVTKNLDRQFNAFSHFNIFYPVDKVSTSDINIDSELPDSDLNVPALKSYIQSGNIEMGKVYHL